MNESRSKGILRLKHLREAAEARGEEMAEQAARFERLRDQGAPRVVSAPQLFQTPETLAARIAGMFTTFGRTLEPSAGLGRLYRAVRSLDRDCPITLVDVSPSCCGELFRATEGDSAARLVTGDFLAMNADRLGAPFDSIIMNPPFRMGIDIRHVRHALSMLAPGGRLVSVVANGPKQRAALRPIASEWIELDTGTFRSEGTAVETALFVFVAPCNPHIDGRIGAMSE